MMIDSEAVAVNRLDPIFNVLAPAKKDIPRTPNQDLVGAAPGISPRCKMVHNGIGYGIMTAYADRLIVLTRANFDKTGYATNVEIIPLRKPEYDEYEMNLPTIAEVRRRGSVIASWLLDLTAFALAKDATQADSPDVSLCVRKPLDLAGRQ